MLRHSRIKDIIDRVFILCLALMLTVGSSLLFSQSLYAQTGAEEAADDETNQEESGEEDEEGGAEDDPATDEASGDTEEEGEGTTSQPELSDGQISIEERQELKRILDIRRELSFVELTQDSDGDGVIDYDEENIYSTDPEQTDTSDNGMADGRMIERGLDSTSQNDTGIEFEDPRAVSSDFFTDDYQLTEVLVSPETDGTEFKGVTQSNQFLTLFLNPGFDPVTVQADELGEWEYQSDEALTDGSYELYMAAADSRGKLLGRSAPVEFSVESGEVTVNQSRSADITPQPVSMTDFLWDNYLLVGILLALIVIIIVVVISGLRRTIKN